MGLVSQSIYNYNLSGIETTGFLVHSVIFQNADLTMILLIQQALAQQ
jgi:hypothetical protein